MDFFDSAYKGRPPWDIGRPQKEFVALAQSGEITGSVLDIGCGTGDNALFYAEEGHEVWGVDATAVAIRKAQEKAQERGLSVHFLIMNVLEIATLGRTFDTVTDSGFFHTLSDADRPVFVNALASVLDAGGNYFMLCFSDKEPAGYGPRRITQNEIRDTFSHGWTIRYIREATFESHTRKEGSRAYLSSISKQ
jgi:cyclopropane fatty-acyl-phospholipid synthase-like methyltransferase